MARQEKGSVMFQQHCRNMICMKLRNSYTDLPDGFHFVDFHGVNQGVSF